MWLPEEQPEEQPEASERYTAMLPLLLTTYFAHPTLHHTHRLHKLVDQVVVIDGSGIRCLNDRVVGHIGCWASWRCLTRGPD